MSNILLLGYATLVGEPVTELTCCRELGLPEEPLADSESSALRDSESSALREAEPEELSPCGALG